MSDDVRKRIFEPFYTTKDQGKGTGLGLASVYGFVKQHSGYVTVDSAPHKGSAFALFLPIGDRGVPRAQREKAAELFGGSGSILVVDDDESIRETAVELLRTLGYEVTACADGRDAVKYFRANHARIDAVVVDLIMPRLDGLGCIRQLRKIDPRVRIAVASGYSENVNRDKVLEEGVDVFIDKPYRIEDLSAALLKVLGARVDGSRRE